VNGPRAYLRVVLSRMLALLVVFSGPAIAVQIEPNPNPQNNTISIIPSTAGENLVPFTNVGTIAIEPLASFQNSSQFNNWTIIPFTGILGGAVINSGTISNSDHFNNYGSVSILEGSRFINLPSGTYLSVLSPAGARRREVPQLIQEARLDLRRSQEFAPQTPGVPEHRD
jgi:hypothetical protein